MARGETTWRLPLLATLAILCCLLAAASLWPLAARNAASLRLLANPQEAATAVDGSLYLRGAVALKAGDAALALRLLSEAPRESQLVRGQAAQAQAQATGDWHTAAATLAEERPLPRFLLNDMLRPHLTSLSPAELDFWRDLLRQSDPLLLMDFALELLIQEKNDDAEIWARSLPGYESSQEARRIVAQAHLNRGQYPESVLLFQELYQEDPSALNAYWVGRALLLDGRYEESIVALQQAVATTQQHLAWYLADLGLAYGLAGRCAEAWPAVEMALANDDSPDLVARVAQVKDSVTTACP